MVGDENPIHRAFVLNHELATVFQGTRIGILEDELSFGINETSQSAYVRRMLKTPPVLATHFVQANQTISPVFLGLLPH